MEAVILLDPQAVLDIGVGFGKYGVLCREYLELWDGRENYHAFTRRIDGLEAFEDYLTPLHHYIYNQIYIGEAQSLIKTIKTRYDLVLLIDVLEHVTKAGGLNLIKNILAKNTGVLISTPKRMEEQGDAFGNPYETHRTQWTMRQLRSLAPAVTFSDPESHIVYLGTARAVMQLMARQELGKIKRWAKKIPWARKMYKVLRAR